MTTSLIGWNLIPATAAVGAVAAVPAHWVNTAKDVLAVELSSELGISDLLKRNSIAKNAMLDPVTFFDGKDNKMKTAAKETYDLYEKEISKWLTGGYSLQTARTFAKKKAIDNWNTDLAAISMEYPDPLITGASQLARANNSSNSVVAKARKMKR